MAKLVTSPQIRRPDDIYDLLVRLHDGLDDRRSMTVSARLILLLANHIGDEEVVREAIAVAGASGEG